MKTRMHVSSFRSTSRFGFRGHRSTRKTTRLRCFSQGFQFANTRWITLLSTVFFEVCGTTCMKLSDGFKKPWPTFGVYACYGISFALFAIALKQWEVSVAYAIWSGAGTALTALMGAWMFEERLTKKKSACLLLIVSGVIGLYLS